MSPTRLGGAVKEVVVEQYLARRCRAEKGWALKLVPVSWAGLPDRLVLLSLGRMGFLELKRPGEKPSGRQTWWIGELRRLGYQAGWTDSKAGVDAFLDCLHGFDPHPQGHRYG